MPTPPHEPQPFDRHQFFRQQGLWWLLMLALLVWNFLALWPTQRPEVELPYTTFVAQVRAGNVAKVHIVGAAITGQFAHPFQWPPPTTPSPAPPASPAPAPQPKPAAPKGPAAQAGTVGAGPYMAFRTTFPEAIGDPGLLSLLESHDVEVTSTTPTRPWFVILLVDGLPVLLLVGLFVWGWGGKLPPIRPRSSALGARKPASMRVMRPQ